MNLITRTEARDRGLKRYFTGAPCSRGHIAERYVATWSCVVCSAVQIARWQAKPEHRTRHRAYKAKRGEYRRTQGGRAARLKYNSSSKGRATFQRSNVKRRTRIRAVRYLEHETPMPADGLCPHCTVPMIGIYPALDTPTQDHILALAAGGDHVPGNTEMICLECNLIKGDRPLEDLLLKIARREFG